MLTKMTSQVKPTHLNLTRRRLPFTGLPGLCCCNLQYPVNQSSRRYLHLNQDSPYLFKFLPRFLSGVKSGSILSNYNSVTFVNNFQQIKNHQPQRSLHVGQSVVVNASFSFNDVRQFAAITQDTNPIHLNEEYAAKSRFGRPVVHGVLVLGFVSGVLGTKMPGIGTIVLQHDVTYPNPTYIGDTVTCLAKVVDIYRGRRVLVHVTCSSLEEEKTVLEGDFNLLVTREILEKGENRTENT